MWISYVTAYYPHGHHLTASDKLHKWLHRKLSEIRRQNSKEGGKIQPCICRAGLKREKGTQRFALKAEGNGNHSFPLSSFPHGVRSCWSAESHSHWTLPPSPLFRINGSFFSWQKIFCYIFDNQQQQFLFCRLGILLFLSPIALLPPFYLFRAQSPWEQDLFLLHTTTGSHRVAHLSSSGLSRANVIIIQLE